MKIAPISLKGTVKALRKTFSSTAPVISKAAYTEDVDKFIKNPEKLLKDAFESKKSYVKPQIKVVSVDNETILAGSCDGDYGNHGNHNGWDNGNRGGEGNHYGWGDDPGDGPGNGNGHGHGHWDD